MEAKDLMIGNYVKINNGLGKDDLFKVVRVVDSVDNGWVDLSNDSLSYGFALGHTCNEIEPIPITDEILSKNFGHEIVFDDYPFVCYRWFTNNLKIEKLSNNMYYWIAQGSCIGIMQIEYVHQLQQILNLLNIDIEFKL